MAGYHHGDLRAALVRAGVALAASGGVEAMTLRAAARAVGVSHAAPARHFADAQAFVAAVAAAGYRELAQALRGADGLDRGPAGDASADALARFRAAGEAYVRFALDHPQWYRVIFHPTLVERTEDEELLAASQEAFGVLRDQIAAAVEAGVVRRAPVAEVALAAWATVHGTAMLLIDANLPRRGYHQPPGELAQVVLATFYAGLAPAG